MKNYEKESFLKIFIIFFSMLALMSMIIAYLYYKEEISSLNNELLYEMREYNFNFQGNKFDTTVVKANKNKKVDKLYISKKEVFALFRISKTNKNFLKIEYSIQKYQQNIQSIRNRILILFLMIVLFLIFLSMFYALYALRPMKKAISLIEDFLKDVIHDINTPITTILLNTNFLKQKNPSEELNRIEISADRILSLYKNFEIEIKGFHPNIKKINIYKIIKYRIEYFKKLYPQIDMKISGSDMIYKTDEDAFIRIIDNLLSNSCKYAREKHPSISVMIERNNIIIKDNGAGIKNVEKVFDRFYKENERGIGIGLNIVQKLCEGLKIGINIKSKINQGTTIKLTLN